MKTRRRTTDARPSLTNIEEIDTPPATSSPQQSAEAFSVQQTATTSSTHQVSTLSSGQQPTTTSSTQRPIRTSSQRLNTSSATQSTSTTAPDQQATSVTLKSNVWEYVERLEQSEPLKAKCLLCEKELLTPNYGTSSLKRHLEQRHNLKQFGQAKERQPSTASFKLSKSQKKQLDALAINAVVKDARSFGDFQKAGMKKFIDALRPGYAPPHRNVVTKQLKRLYHQHTNKIKDELQEVTYLSLTCDFWTDRKQNSFLVITGHHIDKKFDQFSKILKFISFEDRHYSPIIAQEIEKQLIDLNLFNKLVTITCDGASNMRDMFTYFSRKNIQYIRCMAHKLHLILCNSLNLWVTSKKKRNSAGSDEAVETTTTEDDEDDNQFDLSRMVKSMSFDVDQMSKDENSDDGGDNDEAAQKDVHGDDEEMDGDSQSTDTINNALSDAEWTDEEEDDNEEITDNFIEGVNTEEMSLDQLSLMVKELIDKIRETVTMIKSSSIFTSFIERKRIIFNASVKKRKRINRRLSNDVKTRWNSTFKMLHTFNIFRDFVNCLFKSKGSLGLTKKQKLRFTRLELTVDEWDILQLIIELLHPFYSATKVLSNTTYPTIGCALYLFKGLEEYLSREESSQLFNALKQIVLKKFQHYIVDDVEQFNSLKLYAYFDPTGFAALTKFEQAAVEKDIIKLSKNQFASLGTSSTSMNDQVKTKPSNIDKAWQSFLKSLNKDMRQEQSMTSTIEEDLNRYRSLATKLYV